MPKIYLIRGSTGLYADRAEWNVCAFSDSIKAEAWCGLCSGAADKTVEFLKSTKVSWFQLTFTDVMYKHKVDNLSELKYLTHMKQSEIYREQLKVKRKFNPYDLNMDIIDNHVKYIIEEIDLDEGFKDDL